MNSSCRAPTLPTSVRFARYPNYAHQQSNARADTRRSIADSSAPRPLWLRRRKLLQGSRGFESVDGCQRLGGRLSKVLAGSASLTRRRAQRRSPNPVGGLAPTAATQMRPQQEPSTQEVLAGFVERVPFHNNENGFCVLRAKARGHRDLVTVIGHAATISAGGGVNGSG